MQNAASPSLRESHSLGVTNENKIKKINKIEKLGVSECSAALGFVFVRDQVASVKGRYGSFGSGGIRGPRGGQKAFVNFPLRTKWRDKMIFRCAPRRDCPRRLRGFEIDTLGLIRVYTPVVKALCTRAPVERTTREDGHARTAATTTTN